MKYWMSLLAGILAATFGLGLMAQGEDEEGEAEEEVRCCGQVRLTPAHMECPEIVRAKRKPDVGVTYAFLGTCETDAERDDRRSRSASDRTLRESRGGTPVKKASGPNEEALGEENIKHLGKINKRVEGSISLPDEEGSGQMLTFQPTAHGDAKVLPFELRFLFELVGQDIVVWEKWNQLEQKKLFGKSIPGAEGNWKKIADVPQSAFSGAASIDYIIIPSGSATFNLGKAKVSFVRDGKTQMTTTK